MKKKILLTSLLLLTSCAGSNISSSNISGSSVSSISSSLSTTADDSKTSNTINDEKRLLTIHYCYDNYEEFKTVNQEYKIGDKFFYESPKVDFMMPDYSIIEGNMGNDNLEYTVTYSFTEEEFNDVKALKKYTPFKVNDGFTLSYVINNCESDWNVIFKSKHFEIGNGTLKLKDDQGNYQDFYGSETSKIYKYDALLSKGLEDKYIDIAFRQNNSIYFYLNGKPVFCFLASKESSYQFNESSPIAKIEDFSRTVKEDIKQYGLEIGPAIKDNMKYFRVSDVKEGTDYKKYFEENFKSFKINYLDEEGNIVHTPQIYIGKENDEFTLPSPTIENLATETKQIIKILQDKDGVMNVRYHFPGSQKVTKEIIESGKNKLNYQNINNWIDKNGWYKVAENLNGDFSVQLKYHMNGCFTSENRTDSEYVKWRTALSIISNSNTGDRWVNRLDSFGWQDDCNHDGIYLGNTENYNQGYSCLQDFTRDFYNVFSNCDIVVTFTRSGNKIISSYLVKALNQGYENKTFEYYCSLDNVYAQSIDIDITAERANVEILSIYY